MKWGKKKIQTLCPFVYNILRTDCSLTANRDMSVIPNRSSAAKTHDEQRIPDRSH